MKVDKLKDDKFHSWKHKIELLLAFRDLDYIIEDDILESNDPNLNAWRHKDKKAKASIGLTLSDSILVNLCERKSAKDLWKTLRDVFEKQFALNKLSVRRRFFSAQIHKSDSFLEFANCITQLAATLKSMKVHINDEEMAKVTLNGLPVRIDPLIGVLDELGDDETFTFEIL